MHANDAGIRAIYLGIIRAGCVVVSIADSFSATEIASRLRIARAKLIFTQDLCCETKGAYRSILKCMMPQAPRTIVLPCDGKVAVTPRAGDILWDDFLSRSNRTLQFSVNRTITRTICFRQERREIQKQCHGTT